MKANTASLGKLLGCQVLLVLVGATAAQAADPTVANIRPVGGQRGTEVEFIFTGNRLADAKGLLIYEPGFEVTGIEVPDDKHVKAKVKIAPDCLPGERHVRVWTASGISDLRTFYVGPFPTVEQQAGNESPDKAQALALNVSVEGVLKLEKTDHYAVELKKGQRLSVEVEGMRLGNAREFDPCVFISRLTGPEIVKADDSALLFHDPFASIIAPEDGAYLIRIRDTAYGGSDNSRYRMHVGTFPRPAAAYPPGGKAGEEIEVQFLGDASGPIRQKIKLPGDTREQFEVFARQDGIMSPSPNLMRVSDFPNTLEVEPNNAPQEATPVPQPVPFALNGVIQEKGDVDYFRITAKKDETLDLHVYARQLRSPLDSVLEIFNKDGKRAATNDDSGGPDSYLRFKVPADGEYFVAVKDQLGRGGPAFVYRVEVTPIIPRLALNIPQARNQISQERQTIVVPRGNRYATMIRAKRGDIGGELKLDLAGLPPGIKVTADAFADGSDSVAVVFEADSNAEVMGKLCDLKAKPTDPAKATTGHLDQEVELVMGNNNVVYYKTAVNQLAVAVAEEAPFTLRVVPPKVPILRGGALELKIIAERKEGFKAPINVSMLYNPPGLGSDAKLNIAEGQSEATMRLSAQAGATLKTHNVVAIASSDAGKGITWVASAPIPLEVVDQFVKATIERASIEQGASAVVTVTLQPVRDFEGKAKIELLGLPNKTSASPLEITKSDEEVKFNVAAEPTAQPGFNKTLFCRVTLMKDGEPMTHDTGLGGVLRIDPAAKKTADAKPEALQTTAKLEKAAPTTGDKK